MIDTCDRPQQFFPGLVSTVITSYNKGPFLGEAIQSALLQDYSDQEVIVVDDGSSDDTRRVAEAFGNRIRYYFQQNKGPAAAKNQGVKLGTGEYIAFLDGDDRWRPGKLKRQIELFRDRPTLGVVYGASASVSAVIDEAPKPRSDIATFRRGQVLNDLIVVNFVVFSSAVVRRTCIDTSGLLDENERVADDYEFWLRIARHFEFDFVDDVVVDYREGIDQIGTRFSGNVRTAQSLRIQREFVNRFYSGVYPQPGIVRKGIASKYSQLGDCYLAAGKQFRAAAAHSRALCMEPLSPRRYARLLRDMVPNLLASRLKTMLPNSRKSRTE